MRGDQEPDSNTALPHDELTTLTPCAPSSSSSSPGGPGWIRRTKTPWPWSATKTSWPKSLFGTTAKSERRPSSPARQARTRILELIADRILVELDLIEPNASIRKSSEPLVWLLHGSPGTGKSHELPFLRELFGDLLGYTQGIEFQVVAFQAVNAADIKGETIHQAFGLNRNGKPSETATTATQRMGYWRWLIVDEISTVSAKLLARMEQQQRECTSSKTAFKLDAAGKARPFAGVNVVFLGDFYQLPHPKGGFIADVPSSLASARGSGGAADPAV